VEAARARQQARFAGELRVRCNAQMTPRLVRRHCRTTERAEEMLRIAMDRYGLSARAHDRILKLARTRADLEGHEQIQDVDVQLAVDLRMMDRRKAAPKPPAGGPPGKHPRGCEPAPAPAPRR